MGKGIIILEGSAHQECMVCSFFLIAHQNEKERKYLTGSVHCHSNVCKDRWTKREGGELGLFQNSKAIKQP